MREWRFCAGDLQSAMLWGAVLMGKIVSVPDRHDCGEHEIMGGGRVLTALDMREASILI